MPRKRGSSCSQRRRMPSVTKQMRVPKAGAVLESNLVADLRAEAGAALPGHAGRDGAGGDAAGLEHDDAFRDKNRCPEAFAGPGWFCPSRLGRPGRGGCPGARSGESARDSAKSEGKFARDGRDGGAGPQRTKRSTARTTSDKAIIKPDGMNLRPLAKRMPKTTRSKPTRISAM